MTETSPQTSGNAKGSPASPIEKSLTHLLHRAGQCASNMFQSQISDPDLTPRQFAVLAAAVQRDGASQMQLSAMTGIDRSTLAEIVRRLLNRGLLERARSSDDGRAYSVKVTENGRGLLNQATPSVLRVDEKLLSVLPAGQREELIKALALIVHAFDPALQQDLIGR